MSLEFEQIVINKRSGVIHTKNCEAVTQMKENNKQLSKVSSIKQIKESQPCGHCIKKRDLKKLYTDDYERRKLAAEQKRQRDHQRIDQKYDAKQEMIKQIYLENIEGLDD